MYACSLSCLRCNMLRSKTYLKLVTSRSCCMCLGESGCDLQGDGGALYWEEAPSMLQQTSLTFTSCSFSTSAAEAHSSIYTVLHATAGTRTHHMSFIYRHSHNTVTMDAQCGGCWACAEGIWWRLGTRRPDVIDCRKDLILK